MFRMSCNRSQPLTDKDDQMIAAPSVAIKGTKPHSITEAHGHQIL